MTQEPPDEHARFDDREIQTADRHVDSAETSSDHGIQVDVLPARAAQIRVEGEIDPVAVDVAATQKGRPPLAVVEGRNIRPR